MRERVIGELELVDYGCQNCQYFQGHGSTRELPFTAVGNGETKEEALDSILEDIAQQEENWVITNLKQRLLDEYGPIKSHLSATDIVLKANGLEESPDPSDYEEGENDTEYQDDLEEYEQLVENIQQDHESYYYLGLRWQEKENENGD